MLKYIIRLDDACPTMNWKNWNAIFDVLDKYKIKTIIAVIPNNEDYSMVIDSAEVDFWEIVEKWENKGYYIAMHGYSHKYISKKYGLIPMNNKSEFAGVDIDIQRDKIKKAWNTFISNSIKPTIWVAPSHTFDKNTLKVLKEETDIKIISDGVAFYPYNKYGFFWIPQQLWWYSEKEEGLWTICLHPNSMDNKQISNLEKVIKKNVKKFQYNLNDIYNIYKNRKLSSKDRIYFYIFFIKRFLSKIKSKLKKF